MLATATSAATTASTAWTSHAAFATALLEKTGDTDRVALLDTIKVGSSDGLDPKMQALLHISRTSSARHAELTAHDVDARSRAGRPTPTSSWRS
jgi:hypothetical protein